MIRPPTAVVQSCRRELVSRILIASLPRILVSELARAGNICVTERIMAKVCIVGSGNWGSAIARIVGLNCERHADFATRVEMWVYEEKVDGKNLTEIINETHVNVKYLPVCQRGESALLPRRPPREPLLCPQDAKLPHNVHAEPDLATACKGASRASAGTASPSACACSPSGPACLPQFSSSCCRISSSAVSAPRLSAASRPAARRSA